MPGTATKRRPRAKRVHTLGWAVAEWIEEHLCHGPGDVQGDPVSLTDEQVNHLLRAYDLTPAGRRVVRGAVLSRPKGWAKSEFAGMIACAEAVGPVRFSHWDTPDPEDGLIYPVGRPVTSPEILCVATEESQSGNTYDNVYVMLRHLAEHFPEYSYLDVGLTRTFLGDEGEIVPVTAKATSKDGGKSTFVVFDETHLYVTRMLRELYNTIRRNLRKRGRFAEPWFEETTTMYRPGEGSVAEASFEYWQAILDGLRKGDRSLLFDHRGLPDDYELDFNDDDQVREALRKVYGDATHVELDYVLGEIRDPRAEEADSRRYWFNQRYLPSSQAFDVLRWAELAKPEITVARKELVTLGFDGSRFRDSTGLIATHVDSGHQWKVGHWERPSHLTDNDDWEVPRPQVDEAVRYAFEEWKVWRLYADPPGWEDPIAEWAGEFGEDRVWTWYTFRRRAMAMACQAYKTAMTAGDLSHDGDADFARHIANARKDDTAMRDDDDRPLWLIAKDYPNSPRVIDLGTAGVLSWAARRDAIAAGANRRRKGRLVGVSV